MKIVNVTIKGVTSLLQHRFTEENEIGKTSRRMLIKVVVPRGEAEKFCYRTPEGKFYFPGAAIMRLLREAGGQHKMKGSRKSAKYVVPSCVLVMQDAIIITSGDSKKPIADFEVDSRPVVIPSTKGRIMRHRPRFDNWSANFELRINDSILPDDFIHQLLVEGGMQIGIGDYRPEKGGPFGTFNVVEWK